MQPRVIWYNIRRRIHGRERTKGKRKKRKKNGGNARNLFLSLSLISTTDQLQMLSTKRNAANACQDHALDTSHMMVLWDIPSRERTGSGVMYPSASSREIYRQETHKSGFSKYQFIFLKLHLTY